MRRRPLFILSMLATNAVGGVFTVVFLRYILPISHEDAQLEAHPGTLIVMAAYLLVAGLISLGTAALVLRPVARWWRRGGPPTSREQSAAMFAPLRQALVHLALWLVGGVLFVGMAYSFVPDLAVAVIITVCLAASATFGGSYLLGERILRPVAARAMSEGAFRPTLAPGVWVRLMLTWGLGTLVPSIGVVALCATQLNSSLVTSPTAFAVSVLAITCVTVFAAFGLSMLTASQISDPIRQLRRAMERMRDEETTEQIAVYDGSEIGALQVGYNRMVRAVAERARLRSLFGRQVGEDVARQSLERDAGLGGETRFVAVLFVDMIGSTAAAAVQPPAAVVEILNAFFRIVVEVVNRNGGFVNKFVGDEAFAVFGAPLDRPDAPTAALVAARELREELRTLENFDFGIGVSAGTVVAGNVGSAQRYEYTVIGDPVNEAARLTELAKTHPSRALASDRVLAASDPLERERWQRGAEDAEVVLRGRTRPTRLAWPTP